MKTYHPNRSNAYLFSVQNDAEGHAHIAEIRQSIREYNAEERRGAKNDPSFKPKFLKIEVRGRLGKNNPNAMIYRSRAQSRMAARFHFGSHAYQNIAPKHGATLDVYQYTRFV
jgi:hypothetical protein